MYEPLPAGAHPSSSQQPHQSSGAARYQIIERLGEGKHGIVLKAIDLQPVAPPPPWQDPDNGDDDEADDVHNYDEEKQPPPRTPTIQMVPNNASSDSKRYVAIKKIPLRTRKDDISLNALREIKVLQFCQHPSIITLLDMYPDLSGMALVFDYVPHTLYTRMRCPADDHRVRRLDAVLVRSYFGQLLDGLAYLHANRIMHRDIKPANLLIDDRERLLIADFGLSRIFETENKNIHDPPQAVGLYSPQVASRWYRAPELLWGSPNYGPAVDLWAAGCVLAEMLRAEPLFNANTDIEQLALVIRVLGSPTVAIWPELHTLPDYRKITFPRTAAAPWPEQFAPDTAPAAVALVAALVVYNPLWRLGARQARQHAYFA